MLHTKFRENRPCRFWRRSFSSIFEHLRAWRPCLACGPDFAIKLSFLQSMDAPHKISKRFSEKNIFEKYVWTRDGPMSRDDPDLDQSHPFIHSTSSLHLPLFRSRAETVFKNSIVFSFSHEKPVSNTDLDFAIKLMFPLPMKAPHKISLS